MRYRPEVDGLRAVAVVPVVLFHAGLQSFSGGYVGVDVFFVISGYLITGILLKELRGGTWSIGRFYERRARRILPALFVVLLVSIPLALALMLPPQLKDFGQALVAVILFSSNFLSWLETGYFAPASELKPLLHTWSLAVEEQFYLLFPLLLVGLHRWSRSWLMPVVSALACISLAMCIAGAVNSPHENFYLPHARAWELLLGSGLAVVGAERGLSSNSPLSSIGLGLIVASVFIFDSETPFPSAYTLWPVLGSILVIAFATTETWVGRLLAWRPLVWIGLVSYSAYLWHQPLFAFARLAVGEVEPHWSVMAALVVGTFMLAYLTWRFVEQPFRRQSAPWLKDRRHLLGASAAAAMVFVLVGLVGHVTHGYRPLWAYLHKDLNEGFLRIQRAQLEQLPQDDGHCRFNVSILDEVVTRRIQQCRSIHGPGIAILGDSHAIDLFGVVTSRVDSGPFVAGITSGGCRPHSAGRGCQYDAFIGLLKQEPGMFEFVIYEQAGFYFLSEDGTSPGSRELFETVPLGTALPNYLNNAEFVRAVVGYLARVGEYVPVVWLGPRLEPHMPIRRTLRAPCSSDFRFRTNAEEVYSRLEHEIRLRIEDSHVKYLSQIEALRLKFPEDYWDCRDIFWSDGDHYSAAGERRFGARADIISLARGVLHR